MSALDVLRRARALLGAGRDRWTQGRSARDLIGRPCPPGSVDAVCWCLAGAVVRVGGDKDAATHAAVHGFLGGHVDAITSWNDSLVTTYQAVLTRLDAAIAAATERAGGG